VLSLSSFLGHANQVVDGGRVWSFDWKAEGSAPDTS